MAKSTRGNAAGASVRKTRKKAARARPTKARTPQQKKIARKKAPRAALAKQTKARSGGRRRQGATMTAAAAITVAAAADLVAVSMTIDVPGGAPPDLMFVRRMAGVERSNGKASLPHATHTAGWDVVSPTVRPLTFDVKITRDATGTVVLNRAGEKTGADGKGSGADTFTV
jgi:hypothetical protein